MGGILDGKASLSRFDCPKGIAINSELCLVGDKNCVRVISVTGLLLVYFIL